MPPPGCEQVWSQRFSEKFLQRNASTVPELEQECVNNRALDVIRRHLVVISRKVAGLDFCVLPTDMTLYNTLHFLKLTRRNIFGFVMVIQADIISAVLQFVRSFYTPKTFSVLPYIIR